MFIFVQNSNKLRNKFGDLSSLFIFLITVEQLRAIWSNLLLRVKHGILIKYKLYSCKYRANYVVWLMELYAFFTSKLLLHFFTMQVTHQSLLPLSDSSHTIVIGWINTNYNNITVVVTPQVILLCLFNTSIHHLNLHQTWSTLNKRSLWSIVILRDLIVAHLASKFSTFVQSQSLLITVFTTDRHWTPSRARWNQSANSSTFYSKKIHFNITFPSTSRSSTWLLSFKFCEPYVVCDFHLTHTIHQMFVHNRINKIWKAIKIYFIQLCAFWHFVTKPLCPQCD